MDVKSVCVDGFEAVKARPGRVYTVKEVLDARRDLVRGNMDSVAIVDHEGRYVGTMMYVDTLMDMQPAVDSNVNLVVAAAISPFDRARALKLDRYIDALVSDVAHFHNIDVLKSAGKLVKEISSDFVAGNIASDNAVSDVISYVERVDGFRVGLRGGSICITPDVAKAYMPTLYAVALVRDAVDELNLKVPVIADGGMRSPSSIVEALAVGASTAMLAGTDEASAPVITVGNSKYKPYRGMANEGAMSRRFAVDRYARVSKRIAEGVEGLVLYRGSVYTLLMSVLEAIKAGIGYAGAKNIEELWQKARFVVAQRKDIDIQINL